MIFSNNTYPIILVFLISILLQYFRYRRISNGNFSISGLFLIKILIRSFVLLLLIVLAKSYGQIDNKQEDRSAKAVFVVKTISHNNFKLSEDDKINIITKIPESKFNKVELVLYNVKLDKFYVFIPETSVSTFMHLLKLDRPNNVIPLKMKDSYLSKNLTIDLKIFILS